VSRDFSFSTQKLCLFYNFFCFDIKILCLNPVTVKGSNYFNRKKQLLCYRLLLNGIANKLSLKMLSKMQ